jgi:hypothetical protein
VLLKFLTTNKHREKKEEPKNGDEQKRERGLKLEVSRCLDRKGERWVSWGLVSKPRGGEAGLVLGFNWMKPKLKFFIWSVLRHMGPLNASFGQWTKIPFANPSGEHKTAH